MCRAAHRSVVALLAVTSCHEPSAVAYAGEPATPGRPPSCRTVSSGSPVQPVLDDVTVTAVCLAPGPHAGPLRLARAITLWGPREAVIRNGGGGATVELVAAGAAIAGVTIDGTGGHFDRLDAAVRVTADDTRVEGVTAVHAVFGILVERSHRVRVVGNHIEGSRDPATGLRGDTIRIWETKDSVIADNLVEDGRDVVVWYSRGNQITNNRLLRTRYGLHFMYSHDTQVSGNQMLHGVVGIFAMYSRNLHITDNLIADTGGAAGMAIGIKDSGNIFVSGNQLIHNTVGVYLDSSPMQRTDEVEVSRNVLRLNRDAIVFHSSGHRIRLHDNDLADNESQVRVDGGGDAIDVDWSGNYFDDYAGFDLDGDEVGDVPYELRSLSNQLTSSDPNLALFRGTPALALVDAAAHLDPLYQPKPVLRDPRPRMEARWPIAGQSRQP